MQKVVMIREKTCNVTLIELNSHVWKSTWENG